MPLPASSLCGSGNIASRGSKVNLYKIRLDKLALIFTHTQKTSTVHSCSSQVYESHFLVQTIDAAILGTISLTCRLTPCYLRRCCSRWRTEASTAAEKGRKTVSKLQPAIAQVPIFYILYRHQNTKTCEKISTKSD